MRNAIINPKSKKYGKLIPETKYLSNYLDKVNYKFCLSFCLLPFAFYLLPVSTRNVLCTTTYC